MVDTPPTHRVTRVKATATVKVEVHTPLPGDNMLDSVLKTYLNTAPVLSASHSISG